MHCPPWVAAGLSFGPWWTYWAILARAAENMANDPETNQPKKVDSLAGLGIKGIA